MIRLRRGAVPDVPWQSLVIPNTHLAVSTAGICLFFWSLKRCEKLWMVTNDAASSDHHNTQSISVCQDNSISHFHLTTSCCLTLWKYSWGTNICDAASLWQQAKDGPGSQQMSYSNALEYGVKLILQSIYQQGKLCPCSQTWSKCQ